MKKLPSHPIDDAEPTSYVRELLDAGRAQGADGYDVEAGLARHSALVGANAPMPEWAQGLTREALATGAGASVGMGAKLLPWLIAPVVTAGVVAAVMLSAPERSERTSVERASGSAVPAAVEPTAASNAEPTEPAIVPSVVDEEEAAPVENTAGVRVKREVLARRAQARASTEKAAASTGAKPSGASAKSIDALMERARTSGQSSVGKAALARSDESEAASEGEQKAASPSEVAAVTPAPKPVVDDARLEREMGMLATAQRVLKSDPQRALRLARQGEQEFAGSMFTQERQQVLLLALIELGQMPEAKRLALPYLKRYPNGPFSDRLRKALATGRVEN